MPTFTLTTNRTGPIGGGQSITKGDDYRINIPLNYITSGNLFLTPNIRSTILQQLSNQGLVLPNNTPLLNKGTFDVQQRK